MSSTNYTPIPGSPWWKEEEAAALRDWTTMQNAIRKRQRNLNTLYGMRSGGADAATGLGKDFSIDPYSTMGLFQQMFQQQAGGTSNIEDDAIERGLVGSGIGGQNVTDYKYQTDVERGNMASEYTGGMDELVSEYASGQTNYNDMIRRIRMQAAMEAYTSGDYTNVSGVDDKPTGNVYATTSQGQPAWVEQAKRAGYSGAGGVTPARRPGQPAWVARAKRAGYSGAGGVIRGRR